MNYKSKNVLAYLKSKEWKITDKNEDFYEITKNWEGEPFTAIVPKKEEMLDYQNRIKSLINNTLSVIEERDPNKISLGIENVGYDLMTLRIQSDNLKNVIPIIYLSTVFEQVKNALKANANKIISPRPKYSTPFGVVDELLRKSEFISLDKGSVTVTVRVPWKFESDRPEDIVEQTLSKNLGRETIESFTSSLENFKTLKVPDVSIINKNLCDAFYKLLENTGENTKINITTTFDETNKPKEKVITEVSIDSSYTQKLLNFSIELNKLPEEPETKIIANIVELKREQEGKPSEKREIWVYDKKLEKRIEINLDKEAYRLACDAHRDKKEIEANGILSKKGNLWSLREPSRFKIVS